MRERPEKPQQTDGFSAVRWSAASKYGAQALQFGISLVMARLLAPEYFGLVGMAAAVTGFAKTLKNIGFNTAIIQRDDIDRDLLSTLFWINLGLAVLLTLGLVAGSPFFASIYGDVRVAPIIAALSLPIVINAIGMVPSALLNRKLEFKSLAIREIGAAIVTGVTSLTLAVFDWGVWALVCGTICGSVANSVLVYLAEPFFPKFVIDRIRLKSCLQFGLNITGLNLFTHFARNSDSLIIGMYLGPAALGLYSIGIKLVALPRESISGVIARVMLPKLSRTKQDKEHTAKLFIQASNSVAFVTFPMMAVVCICADPLVRIGLGKTWLAAIPVIIAMCPAGAFQSLSRLAGQVYLAEGRSDVYLKTGILTAMLKFAFFMVASQISIVAMAVALSLASAVELVINIRACSNIISTINGKTFLAIIGRHGLRTSIAVAVSLLVVELASIFTTPRSWLLAIVSLSIFATAYLCHAYVARSPELAQISKVMFPGMSKRFGRTERSNDLLTR